MCVLQVCETFGLTNVDLTYTDEDYQTLTTYKTYQQHVRALIARQNPRVPMSKLMMLVSAKWREFSALQQSEESSSAVAGGEGAGTGGDSGELEEDEADEAEEGSEQEEEQVRSSARQRANRKAEVSSLPRWGFLLLNFPYHFQCLKYVRAVFRHLIVLALARYHFVPCVYGIL